MYPGNYAFKAWVRRFFLLVFVIFPGCGNAIAVELSYQIKAAYIYKILQFVSFPNDAFHIDGVLNVCVLGEDRFGPALDEIDGASVPQGIINIVRLETDSGEHSLDGCNALYLVETERSNVQSILSRIDSKEILTIGEFSPFIRDGGLIELFAQNDTIRFKINQELVKDTDFQVAAQLIQLGVRQ